MPSQIFNALGIFGRLDPSEETYFLSLQKRYRQLRENSEAFGVFPHLTLVASYEVPDDKLSLYIGLLKRLRTQLPLMIRVGDVRVDKQNVALSFDISQTAQVREFANSVLPQQVVQTDYLTVLREIPEEFHHELLKSLNEVGSLTVIDFKLCADRVDDQHILLSSSEP